MNNTHAIRKPGLIMAMMIFTGFGLFMATPVDAAETVFDNIRLFNNITMSDLMETDFQVSGNDKAGLHLSTESQTQSARYVSQFDSLPSIDSGVHFSWKMAW